MARPLFRGEKDQTRFVELLEESLGALMFPFFAFVLMGNHLHLIAQTHQPNLTRWMHWLSVAYTVYFNRRHHRSGHLFQGRFKSFLVQGRGARNGVRSSLSTFAQRHIRASILKSNYLRVW